jgi:mannose-1-phosphate guanylyltransferase
MYAVIMAGGGGTRLWPLSRPDHPKPFLPLLSDESPFQRTVARVEPLVGRGNVYCVADQRYGGLVAAQAPDVKLIVEPASKNTAPAIALATCVVERPADEVMVVLPADHWIEREDDFGAVLRTAAERLATGSFGIDDPLVTLGVHPTFASTDYGYLRPDTMRGERIDGVPAYPLLAFEEKPTPARAHELIKTPGTAWNAGMFVWRRRAIQAAMEKYTPLMMLLGSANSDLALAGAYERITPISIDYAVMEGAAHDKRVVMGSMSVGWSDIGSWTALLAGLARVAGVAGPAGGDSTAATGKVMQPGDQVFAGPDDLVVRPLDGRLVVEEPDRGLVVADGVWAHLASARSLAPQVRALLDRVQRQEVTS